MWNHISDLFISIASKPIQLSCPLNGSFTHTWLWAIMHWSFGKYWLTQMFISRLFLWTTEAQSCWGLLGGRVGLVSEWGHLRTEEAGAFVLQLSSASANGYLQGPSLPRTSCLLCLHSMSAPEKLSDGEWQHLAVGSHCMRWDGGCHGAWRGQQQHLLPSLFSPQTGLHLPRVRVFPHAVPSTWNLLVPNSFPA